METPFQNETRQHKGMNMHFLAAVGKECSKAQLL